MAEWFLHSDGTEDGPFDLTEIVAMLGERRLSPADLVWREGLTTWSQIGMLPEFEMVEEGEPLTAPYATLDFAFADVGPFAKIGNEFVVSKVRWRGCVVASPQAIYLLKIVKYTEWEHPPLIGELLAAAEAKPEDDTRTCNISDLPARIRLKLDPKTRSPDSDVIVLRKEAISFLRVPRVNNEINLRIAGERVVLFAGLFSVQKISRFLSANGWTLNREVATTESPIHGPGFGWDESIPLTQRPKLRLRLLYIAIATALFIGLSLVKFLIHYYHNIDALKP